MQNQDRYIFRGKRTDGQGWVEGSHILLKSLAPPYDFKEFIQPSSREFGVAREVKPETVGQLLITRNNCKLRYFEGDIVLTGRLRYGVVVFSPVLACAMVEYNNGDTIALFELLQVGDLLILGDRWDNPELLKQG